MATILDLPERVALLPAEVRVAWEHIFAFSLASGSLSLPETMREWTERLFGSVEAVREQAVVKLINRLTLEGALFNEARARRPAMSQTADAAIDAWIAAELQHDIFGLPEQTTPADVFGRVSGRFCITASNIAKYDGWHGVVICNEPHPLRFDRDQVRDYVETAWRWIEAAHKHDNAAIYPLITWNCMPKSGASLAHGHLQIALGRSMPYVRIEAWRRAAEQYRRETGHHYFEDLVGLHAALSLGLPAIAGVQRFAHLTPVRNREVVLVGSPTAGDRRRQQNSVASRRSSVVDIADALYETLHMLISSHGTRAFNAAIAFPPLRDDGLDWRDVPVFARVGDRGDPLAIRSDIGVMELYGMGVITVDPYDLVESVK